LIEIIVLQQIDNAVAQILSEKYGSLKRRVVRLQSHQSKTKINSLKKNTRNSEREKLYRRAVGSSAGAVGKDGHIKSDRLRNATNTVLK
jgi:hypothetical protein